MPQLTGEVHARTLCCNDRILKPRELPAIGAKRQQMIQEATAEWVSFIDDDDLVPPDYVSRILKVIKGKEPPEVIGFRLQHFVYGTMRGFGVHSYRAAEIPAPKDSSRGWERHDRQPNHLNPVRLTFALRAGYKPLHYGEDGDYARRLALLRPRPRETFLDWVGYHYLDVPDKRYEVVHA